MLIRRVATHFAVPPCYFCKVAATPLLPHLFKTNAHAFYYSNYKGKFMQNPTREELIEALRRLKLGLLEFENASLVEPSTMYPIFYRIKEDLEAIFRKVDDIDAPNYDEMLAMLIFQYKKMAQFDKAAREGSSSRIRPIFDKMVDRLNTMLERIDNAEL